MDNKTLQTLKELVGIPSMYNVEFKASNEPIEHDGQLFNGMCTEADEAFIIEYQTSDDAIITLLHELGHVLEFLNDQPQNCDKCESRAIELSKIYMNTI